MTKVKLAEATKEINQQAGTILEEAARIRRSLEGVLGALRKQEAKFQREEEEEKARKRQEEQAELAKQHTKAWTMPDEDEPAAPAAAESDRSEEKAAAEAAAVKPSEPVKEKKEEKQQAEPAAKPQAETEKPAEVPAPKAEEAPKQEKPVEVKPAEAAKPVEKETPVLLRNLNPGSRNLRRNSWFPAQPSASKQRKSEEASLIRAVLFPCHEGGKHDSFQIPDACDCAHPRHARRFRRHAADERQRRDYRRWKYHLRSGPHQPAPVPADYYSRQETRRVRIQIHDQ